MKNILKYYEEYIESIRTSTECKFRKKYGITTDSECNRFHCQVCNNNTAKWLDSTYVPQIDWTKVPVDTPVIVSHMFDHNKRRHFLKYNEGVNDCFETFANGETSFTSNGLTEHWLKCELAHPEDIEKYSI